MIGIRILHPGFFSTHRYVEWARHPGGHHFRAQRRNMMTSSNENIFRVTGHLCGEFTGPRWILAQRPVTRCFDVFFDLRRIKGFNKQSCGWWFQTLSRPLWRHSNDVKHNNNNHKTEKLKMVLIQLWLVFWCVLLELKMSVPQWDWHPMDLYILSLGRLCRYPVLKSSHRKSSAGANLRMGCRDFTWQNIRGFSTLRLSLCQPSCLTKPPIWQVNSPHKVLVTRIILWWEFIVVVLWDSTLPHDGTLCGFT